MAEDRPVCVYGEVASARTRLVSFARLDLATERDQKRLRHRVLAAVERVCLRDIGRDGLQDRGYYACESNTMSAASPQIAEAVSRASNLA
ncbi:MAG: UrcA family protein [Hyphomicrobium sp.]|nr:UrcA family protein [Hyphomicrobium sp.]